MAPDSTPALVQGSDFSSMKVLIGWTVTAKRPGLRPLRTGDDPRLIELRDDGVTLELPQDVGHVGDRVLFQLQAISPEGERRAFSTPAQIDSVEGNGSDRVAIALRFLLSSAGEWIEFQKLFGSRQDEIDKFLKAAKGF